MLVLPADHVIDEPAAFPTPWRALAANLVKAGGAGHLRHRAARAGNRLRLHPPRRRRWPAARLLQRSSVSSRSPTCATAEAFVADGGYYWNSGMFMFAAERYLAELSKFAPDIASAAEKAVGTGYRDLDFCRLDEASFSSCPSDSIDYAVMERTERCRGGAGRHRLERRRLLVGAVGSAAARRRRQRPARRRLPRRREELAGARREPHRGRGRRGRPGRGRDPDAVLVAHKSQVQRVKQVVDHLKSKARTEHLHHTKVYRPWGHYEGIDAGDRFQVKRITVKPGEKLSLQMHHHRAEHWVVVSGTARVTCGEKVSLLSENESTYIPIGMNHRLENPGKLPLHIIEVQSGSYLGEDDIVRFEDIYKRSSTPGQEP
jgi:mannose-1-phosphate guanylyltransferase/mannose-6-phosphate isomerase